MPIANDLVYGGNIVNDGQCREPLWEEDFEGFYENEDWGEDDRGNKLFLMLWLHAFRYKFKGIEVDTKIPEWAKIEFLVKKNIEESKLEETKEGK
jgi:hypothetical protein